MTCIYIFLHTNLGCNVVASVTCSGDMEDLGRVVAITACPINVHLFSFNEIFEEFCFLFFRINSWAVSLEEIQLPIY